TPASSRATRSTSSARSWASRLRSSTRSARSKRRAACAVRRAVGVRASRRKQTMVRFDQGGRGYRPCREWYPRRDEALYIELLFGQTYREPLITGEPWRVVPDPCAHLLFVAGGSAASGWTREPTLRLVGPRSTYVDIDNTGRTIMLGVRLRPGVLASLMGSDARNLTDQSASAEELFGKAGRELLDRVASSLIPESATRDLAAFVVGRVCS